MVGALIIPEAVLATIGEKDEGSSEIFGIAAGLLLCMLGVLIFALGFEDAKRSSWAEEDIIGAAIEQLSSKRTCSGLSKSNR